ncbi:MAG TPA: glutamate--tRNA ligase [Rhodospirillaceae bacterium]|nr:glutamate--tRNA ligase [Rhodospirillaceae bacterium]
MTIVTRFPPSPTGFMHIGTARTALFNWLFAKHHGGKMLFRIEDTDRARHSEEAVTALINSMKWLELDWDGDIVSQFEQRERHAEVARELLKSGKAYECYCTPEELSQMREQAKKEGRPVAYDRRWRDSKQTPPAGMKPAIRIKAPLDGASTVHDKVQGDVTVENTQLDDFIILRSDGTPTYMLSVVVDDHDMGVTHVIRGDDHLNNSFRQDVLYDAMGWKKPVYAHIPLILGPDGSKMSKRHGAASVEEYREMGYLPEAMRNYLLRLGWSHGDDEIISTAQAIEWFGLEHIQKSPARFDFAKLESVNAHYMKQAGNARLIDLAAPFMGVEIDALARERLLKGADELKGRAKTLKQFAAEGAFYAKKLPFDYDDKAREILAAGSAILAELEKALAALSSFTPEAIEAACKDIAQTHAEGKLGKVAMPLRAVITGTTVSPSVFHACAILGKEESLARIKAGRR